MDPDAKLVSLRDSLRAVREAQSAGSQKHLMAAADTLADDLEELLEWLAKGGFSPDWQRGA